MKNKRTCDYIAEAIQNEILSGRMEAGQPLRQEELSEKLKVVWGVGYKIDKN